MQYMLIIWDGSKINFLNLITFLEHKSLKKLNFLEKIWSSFASNITSNGSTWLFSKFFNDYKKYFDPSLFNLKYKL